MTSATRSGTMALNLFIHPTGHHIAGWRHPQAQADAGENLAHYVQLAQVAESACFDAIFIADTLAAFEAEPDVASRVARYVAQFEPFTLLSALAVSTNSIGLIGTASTTYGEPFHVARKVASLDLISQGRAGWNLVSSLSDAEAKNFGQSHLPAHTCRYERAQEFAQVVLGLWGSWDAGAFVRDKDSGVFFDPRKRRFLNHSGRFFQVRGPLNVARSPQGRPVLVQAGASEEGRALASQIADVVFTAQASLSDAQTFYADIKERARAVGRKPEHVRILPGVMPIVGRTEQEARQQFSQLQALIHPEVGLSLLSSLLDGHDLSSYPLDGPLPPLPDANGGRSRHRLLQDIAAREGLSIRELYQRVAGARGHWVVCGTPAQIADELELRFASYAADGFNVMPAHLPGGLEAFAELVVPELQRRGRFRTQYQGNTLREHLGLPL